MLDFAYRTLDSFFQQLSVNILSLVHGVLDLCLVALVVFMGAADSGVIGALGVSAHRHGGRGKRRGHQAHPHAAAGN